MIPALLIKIALLIIIARCVYIAFKHMRPIDIIFYLSIAIVALNYYLEHFHNFFGIFP